MPVKTIFPTRILHASLPGADALNRKLLKSIEQFSHEDKMGKQWSEENYRGGYTSYASLSDMHRRAPEFTELAERLAPFAARFAKAQAWEMRGVELEMNACWMNVMGQHTAHSLHLHPHSVISGAYFVSAPKKSVALRLEDPRMAFYMNAPVRQTPLVYSIEPKAGTFVLFESWLRHEVPPHHSKQPRISISFNYELVTSHYSE